MDRMENMVSRVLDMNRKLLLIQMNVKQLQRRWENHMEVPEHYKIGLEDVTKMKVEKKSILTILKLAYKEQRLFQFVLAIKVRKARKYF